MDTESTNSIMDIINVIAPLIYLVVPAIYAVCYKVYKLVKKKKQDIDEGDKKKAAERYDVWEHEKSQEVIQNIKGHCDYFKDKGHSDLVQYLQLENGTIATSKIQNMFLTCLAEDSRFGALPKKISSLQRIPFSECVQWINLVKESDPETDCIVEISDVQDFIKDTVHTTNVFENVGSGLIAPIYSPEMILLGMVAFYYREKDFNGKREIEIEHMKRFRYDIESVLVNYHLAQDNKKKELKLK